jgi:TRAP-type uncharacterized transport system fused permease subunit
MFLLLTYLISQRDLLQAGSSHVPQTASDVMVGLLARCLFVLLWESAKRETGLVVVALAVFLMLLCCVIVVMRNE